MIIPKTVGVVSICPEDADKFQPHKVFDTYDMAVQYAHEADGRDEYIVLEMAVYTDLSLQLEARVKALAKLTGDEKKLLGLITPTGGQVR